MLNKLCLGTMVLMLLVGGCAIHPKKSDYSQLRTENPRSILIVPAINKSVEVNAPDYFLSTISKPISERGYYVFPVHLVKSVMEDDGLSDADMVHSNSPERLGKLFGADSVLYVTIERWDSQYIVFSTTTTVELSYVLKSASTGQTLWQNHQEIVYQPQRNNSNAGLAGLIADAVGAAIQKAAPNYIPLARQANGAAINTKGQGLPAGPYDVSYLKDEGDF